MHILLDIADITARVALALAMAFRDDPEPPAPPEPPPAPAPEPEPMPSVPSCTSFTFPQTSFASQPVGFPVPTRPAPVTPTYVPQAAPVFRPVYRPVYPQPIYRAPVYSQPVIPYRHVPFGQPFSQAPVRYTQPAVLPSAPRTTMRTTNC